MGTDYEEKFALKLLELSDIAEQFVTINCQFCNEKIDITLLPKEVVLIDCPYCYEVYCKYVYNFLLYS